MIKVTNLRTSAVEVITADEAYNRIEAYVALYGTGQRGANVITAKLTDLEITGKAKTGNRVYELFQPPWCSFDGYGWKPEPGTDQCGDRAE